MQIRYRIRELRRVRASELQPHPSNWRTHPPAQRAALQGLLTEIGYADALLVRETDTGRLQLIDGHLRAETTPDQEVPVLIVDVNEAEAAKLLATLDPLAGLAGTDTARLEELLRHVETGNDALRDVIDQLAQDAGIVPPVDDSDPGLPHLEQRFAIVVHCESEARQLELLAQFTQQGLECRALLQ